jgi:anthranilate synthase component 1
MRRYHPQPVPGLPRFSGGLVGYLSYDVVRFFEPSVSLKPHPDLPEGIFLLTDTLVAFDHAYGRLLLIANIHLDGNEESSRGEAEERLDALQRRLEVPLPHQALPSTAQVAQDELRSNITRQFTQAVLQAKEHITAGDILQVVLSQRLERETIAKPFDIYRTLRRVNPSPYMFFFDFDTLAGEPNFRLLGASPEMHTRQDGNRAAMRPIAGTRPRGRTPEEDLRLERELLADPKERAEHVMLVDLAAMTWDAFCIWHGQVPNRWLSSVIPRHAHRLPGGRGAAARLRCLQPAAGHLSSRHGQRGSQGARHANYR